MKKLAPALVAVIAAVALAAPALGKGTNVRSVCGASRCKQAPGSPRLVGWGGVTTWSTSPSAYFVVHMRYGDAYWLPESGWFADVYSLRNCITTSCWTRLPTDDAAILRRATAGLEPFQPRLTRVTVAGKPVAAPDSYLPLLGDLHWAFRRPGLRPIRVVLWPARPNPWITGPATVGYDRAHHVLVRSDGSFKVPHALAARLFERETGNGAHLYAGLGIAGLAAVAVFVVARRRRS